jgi:adenylate kinase family enzyme
VKRVVILGRGAAGKSVLAARLAKITGLPVVDLDKHFWKPGLYATPPAQWAQAQSELVRREAWIMDGYRRRSLPLIRQAIADHAAGADVHVLASPRAVRRFLAQAARRSRPAGSAG